MRATAGILGAILLLASVGAPHAEQAAGPALVVLVRHAEPGVAPQNDPSLSDAGKVRAQALATALRDAGITAIFTSTYRRTRETAAPLAAALGLEPVAVPITSIEAHVDLLAAGVRGRRGAVLVVGHSNTVPAVIHSLGGPRLSDLCEGSFGQMFALTLADGAARLVRSHYGAAELDSNCR